MNENNGSHFLRSGDKIIVTGGRFSGSTGTLVRPDADDGFTWLAEIDDDPRKEYPKILMRTQFRKDV